MFQQFFLELARGLPNPSQITGEYDFHQRTIVYGCSLTHHVALFAVDVDRRGHYIVSEYVDKVHNKYRPNFPWAVRAQSSPSVITCRLLNFPFTIVYCEINPRVYLPVRSIP